MLMAQVEDEAAESSLLNGVAGRVSEGNERL
jgi:hypothetical protein